MDSPERTVLLPGETGLRPPKKRNQLNGLMSMIESGTSPYRVLTMMADPTFLRPSDRGVKNFPCAW
jgi:hypothetical protein